jgi:hypothetical protein
MHGGRSTGPRTEAGMARLRAARTIHGIYGAATRASNRITRTTVRRLLVTAAAAMCRDRLPPALAARLMQMPPELAPLPLYRPGTMLTPAQDRAVLRAETAALAPWRGAIAAARAARRIARGKGEAHAPVGGWEAKPAQGEALAPVLGHEPLTPPLVRSAAQALQGSGSIGCVAEAHAPVRASAVVVEAPAQAHASERELAGLAAMPGNRAARRRWKSMQRRLNRALGD